MVDSLCDMNMGQTAELLARELDISRRDQDCFAELSHLRAMANRDKLNEEIVPFIKTNDNCLRSPADKTIATDNGIRNDAFIDKLGKLRPVFDRKEGTVTAGNASQVTDGGAALLLMTEAGLERTGCTPRAKIISWDYVGCDPRRMGLGPVHAIRKLDIDLDTIDLFEINEAFAAQVLACQRELKIPSEKLNVNGGAIALGHPLAASGARLVLTLVRELHHRNLTNGVASLCIGGGQGGAIWIEKV
jgi:acetyl-CoA C-acetyltransferase/acetyl-CoA acyltransferase